MNLTVTTIAKSLADYLAPCFPSVAFYAGAACIANGSYFYTSYGDEPHGTASGRRVLVSRIVDATRPASVHITDEAGNPLGWIDKNALQVVSDT